MVDLVEGRQRAVQLIRIVLAQKSVQLLRSSSWSRLVLARDEALFIVQLSATSEGAFLVVSVASPLKRCLVKVDVVTSARVETVYFLGI